MAMALYPGRPPMHPPGRCYTFPHAQLPGEGKLAQSGREDDSIFIIRGKYPERVWPFYTTTWKTVDVAKPILANILLPRRDDKLSWADAKDTLTDLRLWMHYVTYLCVGISVSSLSLFAPTIVEGIGYTGLNAQLFTIPPYACAYVVTLVFAYVSDRTKNRGLIAAVFCCTGVITFLIQACVASPSLHLRYAMLVLSTCAAFGCLPPLCAWVSDNVRTTTAASLASGLNIAFTGPGQIIGVWIYKDQEKPRYQTGHAVNAASLFLGLVLALGLHWVYRRRNARLLPGEPKWIT